MNTAVPNRGNQSFMNEPINRQLYEMLGKNQNILRYGTFGNKMRSRGTKMDEYPTNLDKKIMFVYFIGLQSAFLYF